MVSPKSIINCICKGILIFTSLFIFCTNKDSDIPELTFNIDSTLLGSNFISENFNLEFRPPLNWETISESLSLKLKEKLNDINKANDEFELKVYNIFFDKESESLCSISQFKNLSIKSTLNKVMQRYKEYLTKHMSHASVRETDFIKDRIHFFQFLIQDNQKVNFKLIFSNKNHDVLQIDYVVPVVQYARKVRDIESSIGSIQLN